MKITHLVFTDGERYPALIDEDGMPDFWVTLFVTSYLRPRLTASAIENIIRNILHFRLWEQLNSRDVLSEIGQGRRLSEEDLLSLRDHCMQNARSIRQWMNSKRNIPSSVRLSSFHPASARAIESVSKEHFSTRVSHIAQFLNFTGRTMYRRRGNAQALLTLVDSIKSQLMSWNYKHIRKSSHSNDPDFRAPPPEAFEIIMRITRSDSPENPYKNKTIRIRNALMFDVMYQTGIRAGELLALRIGDIDFQNGVLKVVRRHDDQDDPRTKQPVCKTLPRDIPIDQALAKGLHHYVLKIRSEVGGANKHPFLFVTHKKGKYCGKPISDTTFRNRIVKRATSVFPDLLDEIHRHGFRHNFNYRLSKKIDARNAEAKLNPAVKPINEKQEIQIRKLLNGWVADSSAAIYNRRHIHEMANYLMHEDMHRQLKHST